MRASSLPTILLAGAALVLGSASARAQPAFTAGAYFETSFESADGHNLGAIEALATHPWQPVTGEPSITSATALRGDQSLVLPAAHPFAQIRLQSQTLAAAPSLFVDFWARPFLTDTDEEFIDFDGALVSFRRQRDFGEVTIFHALTESDGHWITTSYRFPTDPNGQSRDWLRISILRDYATGAWHLYLNGILVFQNIRALPPDDPNTRTVWFLGSEFGDLSVDDFYLGTANPFAVRPANNFPSGLRPPAAIDSSLLPQTVGPRTRPRTADTTPVPTPTNLTQPVLRSWSLEGIQGGEVSIPKKIFLPSDPEPSITAFSPRRDDDGNPLPMEITFTADVELRPGIDLRRVRWQVSRLDGKAEGYTGETLFSGRFDSTLVHTVSIPGPEVLRGLSTVVYVE